MGSFWWPLTEEVVTRLRAALADGRLTALCERHEVEVLTLHGSVARGEPDPRDVDLAVAFRTDRPDLVGLVVSLVDLLGTDDVDVMDLARAGVIARARGLAHGAEPLYEATAGAFARLQMAAMALEMDFAPLRQAQLRLLASHDSGQTER